MKEKVLPNRINEKIVGVQQVRLVGDNVTPGIYSFKEAYKGTGINQHYARNTTYIPSHALLHVLFKPTWWQCVSKL